eukprot:TRINITY_DN12303_c0_g1_i1.p2 TRINITY_DN12303_c0_g1~~TRINITY_DN12303_c0_g1_i1.p2  ORF type:complete len:369 (-),score=41.63 TRINITY_DN12303_c0_g1_i1:48-1154(-)
MPTKTAQKARKEIIVPNSKVEYVPHDGVCCTEINACDQIALRSKVDPSSFIVRYALQIAIALNRNVAIYNIQDYITRIIMLDLAFYMTINQRGRISGVALDQSDKISFWPRRQLCGSVLCKMDGTTPTSLHALFAIPALLFSQQNVSQRCSQRYSQLEMYGATEHESMTTDFLNMVAISMLEKLSDKLHIETERTKRGFWPGGDGFLLLRVYALRGEPLKPITTPRHPRGEIVNVKVLIFRSGGGFPKKVEETAKEKVQDLLSEWRAELPEDQQFEDEINLELGSHETAYGAGFGIIATAQSEDGWMFGGFQMANLSFSIEQRLQGPELKQAAEEEACFVAEQAIAKLRKKLESKSCIDCDQMVILRV